MSDLGVTGPNYLLTLSVIAVCLWVIGHQFSNIIANIVYTGLAIVVAVIMTVYLWNFGLANDPILTVLISVCMVTVAIWRIRRRLHVRNQPPPQPNITINNNFPPPN
jgi:ABC-type iron transport system FetAB permease component